MLLALSTTTSWIENEPGHKEDWYKTKLCYKSEMHLSSEANKTENLLGRTSWDAGGTPWNCPIFMEIWLNAWFSLPPILIFPVCSLKKPPVIETTQLYSDVQWRAIQTALLAFYEVKWGTLSCHKGPKNRQHNLEIWHTFLKGLDLLIL